MQLKEIIKTINGFELHCCNDNGECSNTRNEKQRLIDLFLDKHNLSKK